MSDIIDQATKYEAVMLNAAINRARTTTVSKISPCGVCHYCLEPVNSNQLFCDADCSLDYDKYQHKGLNR